MNDIVHAVLSIASFGIGWWLGRATVRKIRSRKKASLCCENETR